MSVKFSDTRLVSDITRHCAVLSEDRPDAWRVSWLRREVTRDRAVTALLLAEHIEVGATDQDHPEWHLVESFAEELGVDAHEVVDMVVGNVIPSGTPDSAPPDPATLVFNVPAEAVTSDDPRYTTLMVWIIGARGAGHHIAEYLRPGSAELDPTGSRHCGTARIGTEAFDVYLRFSPNQVYAVRVGGPNSRALLGLDQPPAAEQPDVLGDVLARDHVLVAERATRGTDEEDWQFCGLIRGVPADVFDRLDANDAQMVDAIVRAATGEVLKQYEVLHVTLFDPTGARIGTREVDQWAAGDLAGKRDHS